MRPSFVPYGTAYVDGARKAERRDANLYNTSQNIAGKRFAAPTSSFTCPTRAGPSVDTLDLSSSSRLERVAIRGAPNEWSGIRQRSAAEPIRL